MKVVAVNGSPRRCGNTAVLIDEVLVRLRSSGIETESLSLAGLQLAGCVACGRCQVTRNLTCAQGSDGFDRLMSRMASADGIVLGSPVYFGGMTSSMKALVERAGSVSLASGRALRRKVGVAVAAARRAGALSTLDSINHLFLSSEMLVVGSSYWNLGIGLDPGDVKDDGESIETMHALGDMMAWALRGRRQADATANPQGLREGYGDLPGHQLHTA